jgi:hypothetical protein
MPAAVSFTVIVGITDKSNRTLDLKPHTEQNALFSLRKNLASRDWVPVGRTYKILPHCHPTPTCCFFLTPNNRIVLPSALNPAGFLITLLL